MVLWLPPWYFGDFLDPSLHLSGPNVEYADPKRLAPPWPLFVSSNNVFLAAFELMGKRATRN